MLLKIIISLSLYSILFAKQNLNFTVSVGNMPVADLKLTFLSKVTNVHNKPVYCIVADIKTIPWVSNIYFLHNITHTYIETNSFLPVKMVTYVNENHQKKIAIVDINQEQKYIVYKDGYLEFTNSFSGVFFTPESLFYYFSKNPPKKRLSIPNTLFITPYQIEYFDDSIILEETITICGKTQRVFFFTSPKTKNTGLWLTKTAPHLPLKCIAGKIKIFGIELFSIVLNLTQ